MFNLESQITEWRSQMLAAGIESPVPLDELESHLRDDIARQLQKGISAEEAFETAAKRLGCANGLRQEFKKGRLDIRLLSPVYMRVYCFLVAPLVVSLVWASPGTESISVWRFVSVLAVLLITLYIGGLPLFYQRLFTRQIRLMRAALRVGCWFLWTWAALALLSAFDLVLMGNAAGMVGWSVYAATFATVLAAANYDREYLNAQSAGLAAS